MDQEKDFLKILSKVTGITSPYIDELLDQLKNASEKDKEKIYKHISWHIPTGGSRMVVDSNILKKDDLLKELKVYMGEETEKPEPEPDPEPEKTPEEVGTDFAAALKAGGGDINLEADATVEDRMQVTKSSNVNLGGNTITSSVEGKDALIVSGASTDVEVKISNGTFIGEGTDDAYGVIAIQKSPTLILEDVKVQGKNPVMVYSTGAPEITIESGEFIGTGAQAIYYYKGTGKLTINGGTFKSEPYEGKYYTLNIKDNYRPASGDVRDAIEVKGGKFYNFNPANCISEGEGTNFVADGYESVETETGVWEVRPVVLGSSIEVK